MQAVAPNLWIKHYPFSLLGGRQGRVVTVIRLASGKLVIHSTAPFTPEDVMEIEALGTPIWLVDVMLHHDTFAKYGRGAFPRALYLAPHGFSAAGVDTQPLLPIPSEWESELRVLLVDGMPSAQEHVFLHRPSRTLIVADLLFNFDAAPGWTGFFRRTLMGVKESPDCARLYPLLIKDRAAYDESIRELLSWDFDRIIVGHDQPVETNGKELLRQALARKKMLPA
jgi:glyoxylase-like metal-dependent hydrolase (beta-lactamase superfamily II)